METPDMNLQTIRKIFFYIYRRRRMSRFYATFQPTHHTRLLDVGGDPYTWTSQTSYAVRVPVTLLNLRFPDPALLADNRFTAVEGDAVQLPMEDASFDIVFSNSVIEHMTTWPRQQAFAAEARRVGRELWIQTPARSFPIEPHLLAPFFQYLPRRLQSRMARHFTLWGLLTKPNAAQIDQMLSDIRLLTYREMRELFPDCTIFKERVFGMTKSYIAVRR